MKKHGGLKKPMPGESGVVKSGVARPHDRKGKKNSKRGGKRY